MNILYPTYEVIIDIQADLILRYGGAEGIRDEGLIRSALAQPQATFSGVDLYPSLVEKVSVLGFSLVKNHGFIDGNKRIGTAAMDVMLRLNGRKIVASTDEFERAILEVASGYLTRNQFAKWVSTHISPAGD